MDREELRVFLILHAFFNGVTALSREHHDKTITPERLAERVQQMSGEYERALHKQPNT